MSVVTPGYHPVVGSGWVRRPRHRRVPGERGAAAVEFALVVPLLLLLLFGIISYGYMLSFRQAMSQGAAEGARAAVVTADDAGRSAAAIEAVTDALSGYGVTCNSGAMVCTAVPEACDGRTCMRVSLVYRYADDPLLPEMPGLGLVMPDVLEYESVVRLH